MAPKPKAHGNTKIHGNYKEINWKEVEMRMEVGSSGPVIAKCLRIDVDTFYRRFEERYGIKYGEYKVGITSCLPANILLKQYSKAMGGNVELLKLMGKEYCGQGKDEDPQKKQLEEKFDSAISQIKDLLKPSGHSSLDNNESDLNIDESNINNETKS